MQLLEAITPYVSVNSKNFEKRFRKLLTTISKPEINRFVPVLDELEQTKAHLAAKFSNNPLISYQVQRGLGAVCVTCVEDYATGILVKNGFDTRIMARELPYDFGEGGHRFPGIHAYNVIKIGDLDLIIDLDMDPFVGQNTGIVVAPLQADIPVYSTGFVYHSRTIDRTGRITLYKFSYEDAQGRVRTYLEGDTAEYLTIAPYHNATDESRCPLCFQGATVYFSFEKVYVGSNGPYYRIPFTLVCPVFSGDNDRTYQLSIDGIEHISVHLQEREVEERQGNNHIIIVITLTDGCRVQLLLANDGTLAANGSVSFVPIEEAPPPNGFKVRLNAKDGKQPKIILPRPSHR